ncbi:hypothetical protein BZG36_01140 [Bifiguratus adelaidae]|uniref:Uncharacterized protein n=1 Tax=Bifiguratus adelaidae TaxID=1938954 RepID=A0A261Y5Z3_9FUNG|nr:hypothetical protein BZG36_01140 [Bifiguratus adelaidae]
MFVLAAGDTTTVAQPEATLTSVSSSTQLSSTTIPMVTVSAKPTTVTYDTRVSQLPTPFFVTQWTETPRSVPASYIQSLLNLQNGTAIGEGLFSFTPGPLPTATNDTAHLFDFATSTTQPTSTI